jgi:hypothetical protein
VHEDAFGLADDVAAGKSSREVLFCGGAAKATAACWARICPVVIESSVKAPGAAPYRLRAPKLSAMTKRRNDSMQGVVARAAASLDPRHTLTEGGQHRTWNPREG